MEDLKRYIRLDDLSPVSPPILLWGVPGPAVRVRRPALSRRKAQGQVPYLPVSAMWAVRLVPAAPTEARIARLAYLMARDGDGCFYCGKTLDFRSCTIEHLVSLAAGGPDHASNLALSCPGCNAHAGHLSAAEKMRLALSLRLGTKEAGR